jgi:hypothetical protein
MPTVSNMLNWSEFVQPEEVHPPQPLLVPAPVRSHHLCDIQEARNVSLNLGPKLSESRFDILLCC